VTGGGAGGAHRRPAPHRGDHAGRPAGRRPAAGEAAAPGGRAGADRGSPGGGAVPGRAGRAHAPGQVARRHRDPDAPGLSPAPAPGLRRRGLLPDSRAAGCSRTPAPPAGRGAGAAGPAGHLTIVTLAGYLYSYPSLAWVPPMTPDTIPTPAA